MLVSPDLSEVAAPIVPGTYPVRIVKAVAGEWSTGTKFVNWHLETFDSAEAKDNGRMIFDRTPTHGKGVFRLANLYKAAMGVELSANGFDTEELLGKEIAVVVIDGLRDGVPTGYSEVKAVKALS